jgi:hypothetical protein
MNQNLTIAIDLLNTASNLLRQVSTARGTQTGNTRGIKRRADRTLSTRKSAIRGRRKAAVTPIHHAGTVKKVA